MAEEVVRGADGSAEVAPDADPADFYDAAEWTQVLVAIGERFRSRVEGRVLQAMLSELLAAHREFAAAATADRNRTASGAVATPEGERLSNKLSGLQSAVGGLEESYATLRAGDGQLAAQEEANERVAAARAEADLIAEQAATMATQMLAEAADEAERQRRERDEEIAARRSETEGEALKVLEVALADADFIRSSAEDAGARTLVEAEKGAEEIRRAVVEEVAALRSDAEAEIAALRADAAVLSASVPVVAGGGDSTDRVGFDDIIAAAESEAEAIRQVAVEEAASLREDALSKAAAVREEAAAEVAAMRAEAESEAEELREAATQLAERVRTDAALAAETSSEVEGPARTIEPADDPATLPGAADRDDDDEPDAGPSAPEDGAPGARRRRLFPRRPRDGEATRP